MECFACCAAGETPSTNSRVCPVVSKPRETWSPRYIRGPGGRRPVDAVETSIDFKEGAGVVRLLANLDEVDVPYLCGSYLRFVVVRAGRLEKVMLDMWEPYVGFVEGVRAKCRGLWKIYVVSAGGVIRRKVAHELINFIEKKTGAKLVRAEFTRLRCLGGGQKYLPTSLS